MKKALTIFLACLMILLSVCACALGEGKARGVLQTEKMSEAMNQWRAEHGVPANDHRIHYDNLTAAIMDLNRGTISSISTEETVAQYVIARNDNLAFGKQSSDQLKTNFSMVVLESNAALHEILNGAIAAMKADGTLDRLIETELKAYIETEPEAKELPKFEGAKTYKVAVTGDVPPMDFVTAGGKAAGFNVALLAEIASRAQVNFELVQVDTGARVMALSSGKADAIFWVKNLVCEHCGGVYGETMEGTLATDSYFTDNNGTLILK